MKFRHRYLLPSGTLSLHVTRLNSTYFLAALDPSDLVRDGSSARNDHSGAVLYVVAVVFLWGLSIVMLIASYVRKNRMDNNISLYLKEIQTVQRRTRKDKILRFISLLQSGGGGGGKTVAGAATQISLRRASSNSSSVSFACCRSKSPSPVQQLRTESPASGGSLQLLIHDHQQDHQDDGRRYSFCAGGGQNSPGASPNVPPGRIEVKRHSYGCFLPQICIDSDNCVDTAAADSSVSDVDDEALTTMSCRQLPPAGPLARSKGGLITEL